MNFQNSVLLKVVALNRFKGDKMFRRKSKQKKSVEESSDASEQLSLETISDSEENDIVAENVTDSNSSRKKSKSADEPFIPSEIIKELFSPRRIRFEMTEQKYGSKRRNKSHSSRQGRTGVKSFTGHKSPIGY